VFGGHIWELVIVLALALVVFGPKRLPEIGGAMGKGIREFKKGTSDLAELGDATKTEPPVAPPAARPVAATPIHEAESDPVPPATSDRNVG
jgi:TatA/E family protein of Tat protein translocase